MAKTNLKNGLTVISGLGVHNDIELHITSVHDSLESYMRKKDEDKLDCKRVKILTLQVDPQVVGVEDLELPYRLEVFDMFRSNLSDFKETDRPIIINKGTTLH